VKQLEVEQSRDTIKSIFDNFPDAVLLLDENLPETEETKSNSGSHSSDISLNKSF
jgi:hypothetical protein